MTLAKSRCDPPRLCANFRSAALTLGLLLGAPALGGMLIPADARYDEGGGPELKHRTVPGLSPGTAYLWTRGSSATLELPNGRILPASCRFMSPGTSVRLTGVAGAPVEDQLQRVTPGSVGTDKPRRADRETRPMSVTYSDGTTLTFQRNTLAPADLAGEEWHPSLGSPSSCERTPANEWLLNDGRAHNDNLARETLVVAPPGATNLTIRVMVRLKEGDTWAQGCVSLTRAKEVQDLDSRVFTLHPGAPQTAVTLTSVVEAGQAYRVWIFASNFRRFAGSHRFVVERHQVHASGTGVFGSDYVRIGLVHPMWSVRTGVASGRLLAQRLYDQDALAGLKLATTATQIAIESRADVLGVSPPAAPSAVIIFGDAPGGTAHTFMPPDAAPYLATLGLGPVRARTLHVVGGGQTGYGGTGAGTLIRALWLPESAWLHLAPKTDLVVLGDSVAVGHSAEPPSARSAWSLVRQESGLDVAVHGWGNLSLHDLSGNLSEVASRLLSAGNGAVWLALGINDQEDWGPGEFGAAYAALCDALIARVPSVRILCQTPTWTTDEPALGGYRAAIVATAGARPANCQVVDGTALLPRSQLSWDGRHPTTAGHATMAANLQVVLRAAGLISEPPERSGSVR